MSLNAAREEHIYTITKARSMLALASRKSVLKGEGITRNGFVDRARRNLAVAKVAREISELAHELFEDSLQSDQCRDLILKLLDLAHPADTYPIIEAVTEYLKTGTVGAEQ